MAHERLVESRASEVVQRLLLRLGTLSYPQRASAYNYLARCCHGDEQLAATLQQMLAAPGSPLRSDPLTERVIGALRGDGP